MKWLNTDQAAAHLGDGYTSGELRRLAKAKKLPAHKPKGRWLFNSDELDAWVRGTNARPGRLTSGKGR